MASFRQHMSISAILACLLLPFLLVAFDVSLPVALLASLWCWFAGMLPDVDSDTGRPLDIIFDQLGACLPFLVIAQLPRGISLSSLTLTFIGVFYIIKYPARKLLERYTVHRGMFHSIPMGLLMGLIVTIAYRREAFQAWIIGGAVTIGYLSHLALDEIFSIDLLHARVKRSSGTAMTFSIGSARKNILIYSLILAGFVVAGFTAGF